jgi:ribokinase
MSTPPTIAVVGSLNVDRTFRVPHIPAPGETLTAESALTCFGGKGANQAVATARAGGNVRMIGCVGGDDDGRSYRQYLADAGIDTHGIGSAHGIATGSAFITVDDAGENAIVVHPGANHAITTSMIDANAPLFDGIDILLLQLECPLPVVKRAAELARAADARVVLNPSPWSDALHDTAVPVDVYIVNETETRGLTGCDPKEFAGRPGDFGCESIIITRGAEPTMVFAGDEMIEVVPPDVAPVDTVGAGDTFTGAFAVAFAEGQSMRMAVDFANHAAALATLAAGAQSAIPDRDRILAFQAGESA